MHGIESCECCLDSAALYEAVIALILAFSDCLTNLSQECAQAEGVFDLSERAVLIS